MIKLDTINSDLMALLTLIEKIPAESIDADNLVLKLQDLIGERQHIVDSLINDLKVEPSMLNQEIDLTKEMLLRSQVILKNRQDLLNLRKANKRRIGIYKNIESDR
jgi:hypothetical protein